jgi:CDP-diacylglycerol--serine O-phosphatidyltransferase
MLNKFFITDPDGEDGKTKDKQLRRLIPNMITIASMVCGLTAIQMAIGEEWRNAVLLILGATILDTMDGAIARLLNATSKFGAELDSLADFLSFGVAPATIMYLWILNDAGQVGWIAALVFVVASSLRLARFNAASDDQEKKPEWGRYFFSGVPAPAGSGLVLLPMIVYLQLDMDLSQYNVASPLIGLWTLIIAGLMVSRIPTFSSKQIRLPALGLVPTLAITGLFLAMLIHAPWITLTVLAVLYTLLIPVSYRVYKSREKRGAQLVKNNNDH